MLIIVIRTLILYGTVIASLRIMGKRQLGELQPSELVVAIMISDLASVPMQDIDSPLIWGILPVLTLIVAEVLLSYVSLKSNRAREFLTGKPSIIIYDGEIIEEELRRLRFNLQDLMSELRLNNCHDISEVGAAIIETSGKLSVIKKSEANGVTIDDLSRAKPKKDGLPCIIITDGRLDINELKRAGKSEPWLKAELSGYGINKISDTFLMSINAEGKVYVQKKKI